MIKGLNSLDNSLIEALRKGEGKAFEEVYEKYYRMASTFIQRNQGSEDDAKDIFQEMLFVLVKKLRDPDFELTAKLSTYIYSILRNLWYRRLKKRKTSNVSLDDEGHEYLLIDDDELAVKEEHEQKHVLMAKVFEELNEDCREIILSSFYKKLSHEVIAEQMGYTIAFVRVKRHRCMEGFRKKVKQHPDFQLLD